MSVIRQSTSSSKMGTLLSAEANLFICVCVCVCVYVCEREREREIYHPKTSARPKSTAITNPS